MSATQTKGNEMKTQDTFDKVIPYKQCQGSAYYRKMDAIWYIHPSITEARAKVDHECQCCNCIIPRGANFVYYSDYVGSRFNVYTFYQCLDCSVGGTNKGE